MVILWPVLHKRALSKNFSLHCCLYLSLCK